MTTLNHLRLPQIVLASILAEPNPHIDLRIQAYKNSARNFFNAISSYKNHAIATIADLEAETDQCKVREIGLVADLEREKEERKDGELSDAAFRRQLSVLREKAASIDAEIEHYRAIVGNLCRERDTERSTLATHAAQVSIELEACQKHAALFVEGMTMEGDQLLFRFTHVQQMNPAREFSFVLQATETGYRVKTSSPAVPLLVEALNSSRDVHKFIKSIMRVVHQELATIGG
ncbi:hypothetical protein BD779DRAFT_1610867 [Infundibulicybe gibba]|nr:hypothetical protein BD779DRAFT_1610867 [Infundibulicybe gibba]